LRLIFGEDAFIPEIGFWFTGIPDFRCVASRGVKCGFIGGVACGVADTVGVGCWLVTGFSTDSGGCDDPCCDGCDDPCASAAVTKFFAYTTFSTNSHPFL
jgi:hypothetical protein